MAIDLRISGGTLVMPDGTLLGDLLVSGGPIAVIVSPGTPISGVLRDFDAKGKHVLPGMVDVHVHTREREFTQKEDIRTATKQAAPGGVTKIFGMPNLDPPTTLERLEEVFALYEERSIVDWNHNPAATNLEEIPRIASSCIRAYKVYMVVDTGRTYPHPAGTEIHDHGKLLQAMDLIAATGLRFIIHPHDQAVMDYIEGVTLASGNNTPEGYARAYAARDGVIWDTAVEVILRLAEASECPIHIGHMQTRRSINAVRRYKERGLPVTCEVNHWAHSSLGGNTSSGSVRTRCPIGFQMTHEMRSGMPSMMERSICAPPTMRPISERRRSSAGRRCGARKRERQGSSTSIRCSWMRRVEGRLSLRRVVELVAKVPSRPFGREAKGNLSPGKDAAVVIADLDSPWTIANDGVLSRCGWTPYDGVRVAAQVERTFVRGIEVFADGQVIGQPGFGRLARGGDRREVRAAASSLR